MMRSKKSLSQPAFNRFIFTPTFDIFSLFIRFNRPLKNVFEVADARQKQAKKRSLCLINEHFESVFNTAAATQIVFQRPVNNPIPFGNVAHSFLF